MDNTTNNDNSNSNEDKEFKEEDNLTTEATPENTVLNIRRIRPKYINIFDHTYRLTTIRELSLEQIINFELQIGQVKRFVDLKQSNKTDIADSIELAMILDNMVHIAVRGLPDESMNELSILDKLNIVTVFMNTIEGSKER